MVKTKILWVDDEVELLKPHIIFLENKDFLIQTCNNGSDAVEMIRNENFEAVLLDENMPGLNGIETLTLMRDLNTSIPIIMITKSEEENIMDDAIGNKISDYLIKPVNPNQILLSLKKNLNDKKIISDKTVSSYQQEFRNISIKLSDINTIKEWTNMYLNLVSWEVKLEENSNDTMMEILVSQKNEANRLFAKFIDNNYKQWVNDKSSSPLLSNFLIKDRLVKELSDSKPTLFLVIDNLRYDQWRVLEPLINEYYNKTHEEAYFSILPTTTQYARNSLFSGLMPSEIAKIYPNYWKNDPEEGGKNLYEEQLLKLNLKKLGYSGISCEYNKITNLKNGQKLSNNLKDKLKNDLTVVVYNFVDMLSHSKTEMEIIKELASNDKGYRSLTLSWFKNSPLFEIIKKGSEYGFKLVITTDHGTINVKNPSKIIGNRETSQNLRYKTGRSLTYNQKEVVSFHNPNDILLPSISLNSSYVFAKENTYLVYPNNYNYYVNFFRDTYQHGGISLEEIIIPYVVLMPRIKK
ncbi:MAG TPA: bifunctional response regulator/alkaline phosphatase family protein [Flavobacteriaceae bacterium]|nr:bifunctional response regulator/alkaline phosphatase family protein [Flavobacteriaceae bacterium]